MNKDQSITYAVAFKGAIELIKGDTDILGAEDAILAGAVFSLTDLFYEGLTAKMGQAPAVAPAPAPATAAPQAAFVPPEPPDTASHGAEYVTTITDPGFHPGQVCPKCGQGQLIIKTSRDGTKAWLQCSDKKSIKQGDSWVPDPNTCQLGPFDDSFADRKSLWQT